MEEVRNQDIVEIREVTSSIELKAKNQKVENQGDVDNVNVVLGEVAEQLKKIEEKRKSFTQPLNQSLKEINKTFKELATPLENVKSILMKKIMEWRTKEQRRIREEEERIRKEEERRRKIQEAHKEKGHNIQEPIILEKPIPLKETDSTKIRKIWKFEITDLQKIPREYLCPDEIVIRDAVRNGVREISGIRIYQEEVMVIGG